MQPTWGRARYDVNRPADGKSTRMSDNKLWFAHFAQWASRFTGRPVTFMLAVASIAVWARTGPLFGLQRYLAARDQHRDHHHHLPHGVRDPEHPEPRYRGDAYQDRRTDQGDAEGAQRLARPRGARRPDARALRKDYEKLARRAKSQTRTPR